MGSPSILLLNGLTLGYPMGAPRDKRATKNPREGNKNVHGKPHPRFFAPLQNDKVSYVIIDGKVLQTTLNRSEKMATDWRELISQPQYGISEERDVFVPCVMASAWRSISFVRMSKASFPLCWPCPATAKIEQD